MTDLKLVQGYKDTTWTNPDNGVVYPVKRLYVTYPSNAGGLVGLMTGIFKCKGEDIFKGIQIGDYVQLLYDQYGNVSQIQPVVPEPEDLRDFGA